MSTNRKSSRGQVLILAVLMLVLFFGFAALAMDVVYAYVAKAALVSALDASALAGIRAVTNGPAAAAAAVDRTFNANFPAGFMGTISSSYSGPTIVVQDGAQKLTLTGTAMVPTFFARVIGYNTVDVGATATAFRRDLNLILVLDYSGSLRSELPDVQDAAKFFVDGFDESRDQVGLVSFSTAARLDYPPQTNFKIDINNLIDSIETVWSTNSSLGLWLSHKALNDLIDPGKTNKLNVIVFFTDGDATSFTSQFPVQTSSTPSCPSSPQEGVLSGAGGWGGSSAVGLFEKDAPPPPVPNEVILSDCPGLIPGDVDELVLSIPDFWYPAWPSTSPAISISGPNPVSTTSITGGNLRDIAENVQINTAEGIRQDPLEIMIATIGLGSVNQGVLQRVANDPSSPFYNSTQPAGIFAHASDPTQLEAAFQRVASSIDRLIH